MKYFSDVYCIVYMYIVSVCFREFYFMVQSNCRLGAYYVSESLLQMMYSSIL